jgi:hypothetical protein
LYLLPPLTSDGLIAPEDDDAIVGGVVVLHLLVIATVDDDDPVSDIGCKGSNFKLLIMNCCSIFWLSTCLEAENSEHNGSTSLRRDIIGHKVADDDDLVLAAKEGFFAATSAAATAIEEMDVGVANAFNRALPVTFRSLVVSLSISVDLTDSELETDPIPGLLRFIHPSSTDPVEVVSV